MSIFISQPAEVGGRFGSPGGFLTWTVRKDNMDSVHAARVHGHLYGNITGNGSWDNTVISDDHGFIQASNGIVSPFYESPSVHVLNYSSPVISAVSKGLSIFSESHEVFTENVLETPSSASPVSVKMGGSSPSTSAVGYFMDSGTLYHENKQGGS